MSPPWGECKAPAGRKPPVLGGAERPLGVRRGWKALSPGQGPRGTCSAVDAGQGHHCVEPPFLAYITGITCPMPLNQQSRSLCFSNGAGKRGLYGRPVAGAARDLRNEPLSALVGKRSSANMLESLGAWTLEKHFKTSKELQRHVGLLRPRLSRLSCGIRSVLSWSPRSREGKMKNKVFKNYRSFFPSSPPLLPFQVDRKELCPLPDFLQM